MSAKICHIGFGAMTMRELFEALEQGAEFADAHTGLLAATPFDGFFLEHPPVTLATFDRPAELVLVDGPALARLVPDPTPFGAKIEAADVVAFPNRGGDATLVVPRPIGPPEAYTHLAAFLRKAPRAQVRLFWQTVARTLREHLGPEPRWLSTAGMGVSWLHARIDTRPKYYRHRPYTS